MPCCGRHLDLGGVQLVHVHKSFVEVAFWQFRELNEARIWANGIFDYTNKCCNVEPRIAALKLLMFVPQLALSHVAENIIFRGSL